MKDIDIREAYRAAVTKGHPIKFDADAARKEAPEPGKNWHAQMVGLKGRVRPSENLTAIMSMLVTGYLPNGVDWDNGDGQSPRLPFCPLVSKSLHGRDRPEYIMCCGHVLTPKKAQELVTAGLLDDGPIDRHGRATLVITPAGREWLLLNWRGDGS